MLQEVETSAYLKRVDLEVAFGLLQKMDTSMHEGRSSLVAALSIDAEDGNTNQVRRARWEAALGFLQATAASVHVRDM